ncbi:ube2z, partial [Symbiodinium sp. KB8]
MLQSEVDVIFNAFDQNKDGGLSREEFEKALAAHRLQQVIPEPAAVPVYGPPRTAPGAIQTE